MKLHLQKKTQNKSTSFSVGETLENPEYKGICYFSLLKSSHASLNVKHYSRKQMLVVLTIIMAIILQYASNLVYQSDVDSKKVRKNILELRPLSPWRAGFWFFSTISNNDKLKSRLLALNSQALNPLCLKKGIMNRKKRTRSDRHRDKYLCFYNTQSD